MTQVLHPLCMQQQLFKCKLASVKVPLATIRVKLTVFTLWSVLRITHLTSSNLISTECAQPRRCEATQFAAAATSRSALSSDEMKSVDMRSDEVR